MKTHVPKIRNVGKAFAEWINSEEKIAKVFRQLTELTADLARELLRTRRGRSKTLDRYAGKIDPILRLIAKRYPTQVELANFPFSDDMPVFDEQPVCPIRPGKRASAAALDKLKDAAAAAYGLRQFRWLADHGAFADFRRCALAACNKYFFPLRT